MEANVNQEYLHLKPEEQIINLLLHLKKLGRAEKTLQTTSNILRILGRKADLNQPDEVLTAIANMRVSNTYKRNLVARYATYVHLYNIKTYLPKYPKDTKMPKIPTHEKVEMLISASGKTLALKLRIMAECGLRPAEVLNLKLKDIDLEHRLLYPDVVKHGNPRCPPFSPQLAQMLNTYLAEKHLQPNDKLFNGRTHTFDSNYREMRDALAERIKDPTLKTIRLYDLRHYFATMLYHKTNNIVLVKTLMGHKHLDTTMIYTQLVNFAGDEYTTKTATTLQEIEALASDGYTKFDEFNGVHIFRRPK